MMYWMHACMHTDTCHACHCTQIEPMTRIFGEYSLRLQFRASNQVIGILVSPYFSPPYFLSRRLNAAVYASVENP